MMQEFMNAKQQRIHLKPFLFVSKLLVSLYFCLNSNICTFHIKGKYQLLFTIHGFQFMIIDNNSNSTLCKPLKIEKCTLIFHTFKDTVTCQNFLKGYIIFVSHTNKLHLKSGKFFHYRFNLYAKRNSTLPCH